MSEWKAVPRGSCGERKRAGHKNMKNIWPARLGWAGAVVSGFVTVERSTPHVSVTGESVSSDLLALGVSCVLHA